MKYFILQRSKNIFLSTRGLISVTLDDQKKNGCSQNVFQENKTAFNGILSQIKLLFGPLVIQLGWYILKQLFTSVSVKVLDIYLHFGQWWWWGGGGGVSGGSFKSRRGSPYALTYVRSLNSWLLRSPYEFCFDIFQCRLVQDLGFQEDHLKV